MNPIDPPANREPHSRLPGELIDRLTQPVARFLRIEAAAGAVLFFFALAALVLSNTPWAEPFMGLWQTTVGVHVGAVDLSRSLRGWINDGLMTLFFFLMALELKRELVLGELREPRQAVLPVAAALGGMLVPAAIYWGLQSGQTGALGWGTVMATDTAFVVGALALLGRRIPKGLRVFMLSVAIVDDIGAIAVVAIAYGGPVAWPAVAAAAVGVVALRAMSLLGVRSFVIYSLAGIGIWLCLDMSGIHATLSGVVLGLMTPTGKWVSEDRVRDILERVVTYPSADSDAADPEHRRALRMAEAAARETVSPVERLELLLHPWVGFVVMPLFAFANAGLPIAAADFKHPVTFAVFAGFALGKPLGIVVFSWLAVRSGLAIRPADLHWRAIAGGGLLAGIGFTMALFIANLAFGPELINSAKSGILAASVFSALAGMGVLYGWPWRRRA